MLVRELQYEGFRNLHPARFCPGAGVNILYGDNAQGKTNLLEACWLFTGARSFRGAKDSELITFGAPQSRLRMAFTAGEREQEAAILIQGRRQVTLNGVKLPSAARLAGTFCGVVFSPAHLSLIKDGPDGRRRFVDAAYCQLRPAYIRTLAEYQKVLTQRNAFLKNGADDPDMLELWDNTLSMIGARITLARQRYIAKLKPLVGEIYGGLSGGRETLTVEWPSPAGRDGDSPADVAQQWQTLFKKAQRADRAAGFSTVGPHREDMELCINGTPARVYGSQGQQRSAVLALKMAEAMLLQEITSEPPVAFLDDVMSELDVSRQDYILNHIREWQVFITCCEPSAPLRLTDGEVFHIKQGVISQ